MLRLASLPSEHPSDHCLELQKKWHSLRKELEDFLESQKQQLSDMESITKGQQGPYKNEVFRGHCMKAGPGADNGYLRMSIPPATLQHLPRLLWDK